MTDKEKIRLEILRRRDSLSPFDYENEAIEWNLLDNLLNYIDSLPERIKAEDVIEVPELTELEKKAKIYAIEQVLCTTDTRMCEQAYLSLKIFNGYDVACAYKDGAESHREQMMKGAIEAVINSKENDLILYQSLPAFITKNDWHSGDKVKLIIIKEEEK